MRFVEKHHKFGLLGVAHFGQRLKQFSQHPQQKRAIHTRAAHQLFGIENIDHAFAALGLHPVFQIERRLTEKVGRAFVFERKQLALHRAHAGGRHIAVLAAVFGGMIGHMLEQAAQIF